MAKITLTAGRIEKASCPEGTAQTFLWDEEAKGLGLRVTSAGAKSFIYQGKLNGQTIRITIGSPDTWPIETQWGKDVNGKRTEVRRGAREEARRLQGLIDQGIDPRQEKADKQTAAEVARIEAKRQTVTVRDAWLVYLEERRSKWSELNYRDHVDLSSPGGQPKKRGKGLTEPGPLASLMPLKLSDLTAATITEWMSAEAAKRPARARLAFNLLRIFAGWCETKADYRGLINEQALSTRIAKDALPRRQPKTDAIQREQLAAWFKTVQQIGNPVMSAYLIGLLITGARREELAGLKWDDVDFQWRSLTIRDKVEGQRIIPLPPYLVSLLLDLKRINETPPNVRQFRRLQERGEEWKPSPWVFYSKTAADGKLASPNAALHRACQTAGIPPITLHGLRRSFSSLAEWTETPTGVVAQIMGHKPSATAERHYKVRPLDLLRVWHDKLEGWILEQAGIRFDSGQVKPGLLAVK